MQTLENVSRKLVKRQVDFEVGYYHLKPYIRLNAVWDGKFNLLKNLLDYDRIDYKTGQDTAGYFIIIEVE